MKATGCEKLLKKFPSRERQIKLLQCIFGKQDAPMPSSIFVHGMHATGKTSIIKESLKEFGVNFAFINCIECYTNGLLFEPIISQLTNYEEDVRCDDFMDFISAMQVISSEGYFKGKTVAIVLDGVEYLYDFSENILTGFLRLQSLMGVYSLSVVLISHILPQKFNLDSSTITLHFPQYTKDELMTILMVEKPEGYSDDFFENYLNAALSVFLRSTRDLNEMKLLVVSNFKFYCDPIKQGLLNEFDVSSLWRHVTPYLKQSLSSIYQANSANNVCKSSDDDPSQPVSTRTLSVLDLPYYAKYFLISAYLASYNSPKYDRRLFMKFHGKQRKRALNSQVKANVGSALLGPKPFFLDRLLAIFYSIMDEKASLTSNLMSQISTLVELKLIGRVGEGSLDKPKYKCLVNFTCVESVARTLGFNVKKYIMG